MKLTAIVKDDSIDTAVYAIYSVIHEHKLMFLCVNFLTSSVATASTIIDALDLIGYVVGEDTTVSIMKANPDDAFFLAIQQTYAPVCVQFLKSLDY